MGPRAAVDNHDAAFLRTRRALYMCDQTVCPLPEAICRRCTYLQVQCHSRDTDYCNSGDATRDDNPFRCNEIIQRCDQIRGNGDEIKVHMQLPTATYRTASYQQPYSLTSPHSLSTRPRARGSLRARPPQPAPAQPVVWPPRRKRKSARRRSSSVSR